MGDTISHLLTTTDNIKCEHAHRPSGANPLTPWAGKLKWHKHLGELFGSLW